MCLQNGRSNTDADVTGGNFNSTENDCISVAQGAVAAANVLDERPSCVRARIHRWWHRCLYHGDVGLEDLLDELVLGGVHQLDDVRVQAVSVLLQKPWQGGQGKYYHFSVPS